MIKRQFTLYVENKPGALARISRMLADAKVNLEGISTAVSGDVGLIQIVASDAGRTARILKRAHIPYTIQQVLVEKISDKVGSLARITGKLAARGININYLYSTCSAGGGECTVVISGADLKLIRSVWNAHTH